MYGLYEMVGVSTIESYNLCCFGCGMLTEGNSVLPLLLFSWLSTSQTYLIIKKGISYLMAKAGSRRGSSAIDQALIQLELHDLYSITILFTKKIIIKLSSARQTKSDP